MWLDLSCLGKDLVWRHPCPSDIISDLVSSKNREGTITNSKLELAALIIHEAALLTAVPNTMLAAPHSGLANTLNVSYSTKEASTINPVVVGLIRIHALHSRQFFVNLSVFIIRSSKNCMADGASCLFDLSDTSLLAHMSADYPRLHSLWKISLPPPGLLSCVISTMRRKTCERELYKMLTRISSTISRETSVPP